MRRELDGFTAILESHFQWEERRITRALDELEDRTHTGEQLFGITLSRPGSHGARCQFAIGQPV
ncbi:hypothetical protein [Nocardia sp. NPDC050710]|uniref:hypothetical protein n=1 Tax=Nocardia sp. NPDC050710 TaxID=3157220 RepID=UPI0033E83B94